MDKVESDVRTRLARIFNEYRLAKGLNLGMFAMKCNIDMNQACALLLITHDNLELQTCIRAAEQFGVELNIKTTAPLTWVLPSEPIEISQEVEV